VPDDCRQKRKTKMTTKVKIALTQQHMPVVVDVVYADGRVGQTQTLRELGSAAEEYVHSGQTLRVREMTTQEAHEDGLRDALRHNEKGNRPA
jgi:hypothetical protein